ncbi:hypothetical protein [Leptolyngbya sp. NIES-2104]|nr:hypothetical protein [Leptolyngbya sp. NIES-2104]GAP96848.1 hypothetical protein NIES2104_33950 [Leptolyngbya sp. NIES-2104]
MSNPPAASPIPESVLTVSQDKQDIVTAIERFDVPMDQQKETEP